MRLTARCFTSDGITIVALPMDVESALAVILELDEEPICGFDRVVEDDGTVRYIPGHWPDGQEGEAGWVRLAEIDEADITARISVT